MRAVWSLGALTGWISALALTLGRAHEVQLPCIDVGACQRVQQDAWSTWFGIPVSAVACAYFLLALVPRARPATGWIRLAAVAGCAVALAYQVRSLAVLRSSCPWCLGVFLGTGLLALAAMREEGIPALPWRSAMALFVSGILLASSTLPWSTRIPKPFNADYAARRIAAFPPGKLVLFLDLTCPASKRLARFVRGSDIIPKFVSLGSEPNAAVHTTMYIVPADRRAALAQALLESDGRWATARNIVGEFGVDLTGTDTLESSEWSVALKLSQADQDLAEGIALGYVPVGVLNERGTLRPFVGQDLLRHLQNR